ncbi:MAG: N-acetyl-gamma-glutamyl-phosphate reductase [Mariprofundus sp.]|nr:N-acetyl-gamma-glutamyl-phosphate reductase [Mariprofundus sp.]
MTIPVAILGATGYAGAELVRMIDGHPNFAVAHLGAHTQAGKRAGSVLPGIAGQLANMTLAGADAIIPDAVALVFTALPHAAAAKSVAKALALGKKVVDLSADFRHQSPAIYQQAYGIEHPHPELFKQAVYGLCEHTRDKVAISSLVANPGCYPTSMLLPLIPLLKADVVHKESIIVDAKSGASGAGRSAKTDLLYCELNESVKAYGLPRHRHAWEMEEWAEGLSGAAIRVRFVPHILPMGRGMLSTLHLSGSEVERWHGLLEQSYRHEPFIRLLPLGELPSTAGVRGSNRCDIGISLLGEGEAVIVSCIDNLIKGAAGQAIQNANLMFSLNEETGLPKHATWP